MTLHHAVGVLRLLGVEPSRIVDGSSDGDVYVYVFGPERDRGKGHVRRGSIGFNSPEDWVWSTRVDVETGETHIDEICDEIDMRRAAERIRDWIGIRL